MIQKEAIYEKLLFEAAIKLGLKTTENSFSDSCRSLHPEHNTIKEGDLTTSVAGTPMKVWRLGKPWVLHEKDRIKHGLPPGTEHRVLYAWGIPVFDE